MYYGVSRAIMALGAATSIFLMSLLVDDKAMMPMLTAITGLLMTILLFGYREGTSKES